MEKKQLMEVRKMGKIVSLPPYSNRGVENTSQNGLRALVDWLQVTFKDVQNITDIIDFLGLEKDWFKETTIGNYGYDRSLRFGHISIYYYSYPTGREGGSYFHLEMTGQGCREYEELSKYDWITFFELLVMLDVNVTRLDLAIDDFKGYFTIKKLVKKIKKEELLSKFKRCKRIEDILIKDGSTVGETLYFGQSSSDIQVRIYDKMAQQLSLEKELPEDLKCWIRTEVQMRDKRALQAVFELIHNIQNVGATVQGILRNYIKFVDAKEGDSNKSRWAISKFWTSYLNNVEPLKLTLVAPDKTIEQAHSWIKKGVAPTLSMVFEALGDKPEMIDDLIELGKEKRSKKHELMLARYQAEQLVKQKRIQKKKEEIEMRLTGGRGHKVLDKSFFEKRGKRKVSSLAEDTHRLEI